jgi:accessory gene regulator protein AgrB
MSYLITLKGGYDKSMLLIIKLLFISVTFVVFYETNNSYVLYYFITYSFSLFYLSCHNLEKHRQGSTERQREQRRKCSEFARN